MSKTKLDPDPNFKKKSESYLTHENIHKYKGCPKKTEPCIEYAKYQTSVNIVKWKVHCLLHMTFCQIMFKFCLKIFINFLIIVNLRNMAENPF